MHRRDPVAGRLGLRVVAAGRRAGPGPVPCALRPRLADLRACRCCPSGRTSPRQPCAPTPVCWAGSTTRRSTRSPGRSSTSTGRSHRPGWSRPAGRCATAGSVTTAPPTRRRGSSSLLAATGDAAPAARSSRAARRADGRLAGAGPGPRATAWSATAPGSDRVGCASRAGGTRATPSTTRTAAGSCAPTGPSPTAPLADADTQAVAVAALRALERLEPERAGHWRERRRRRCGPGSRRTSPRR